MTASYKKLTPCTETNGCCKRTTVLSIPEERQGLGNNQQIDWPSNSPDLNPIENLWAVMKKRLLKKTFKNSNELREGIIEVWDSFDPTFLQPLCLSMDKRIQLCLKEKGKKINY